MVLGHIARFVMNAMLASGDYPLWHDGVKTLKS